MRLSICTQTQNQAFLGISQKQIWLRNPNLKTLFLLKALICKIYCNKYKYLLQRGDAPDRLAWNDEASVWYHYEAESPSLWSLESDTAIGSVVLAEFESRMGLNHKATWIEQCIKILKWRMLVKKWEQPSKLIPFCNGVLDTQSGQLLAHAPGYRFTWTIPRNHNPLATDWRTIEEWMDLATVSSQQIKNILLCWLNACLKGRADLQRFLHLCLTFGDCNENTPALDYQLS